MQRKSDYVPTTQEPDDLAEALAPLRLKRQADFVRHFVEVGNATEAARRAGYSVRTANRAASQLLKQKHIQDAVAATVLAKQTEWTFERTSRELESSAAFARETKNATALVRAMELMAKLHGHLIERQDIRAQGNVLFNFPERRVEPIEGEAITIEGEAS